MDRQTGGSREALILAGMDELQKKGVAGFSMRKAAAACGLSCAAPYKHFQDKEQFIGEILKYIRSFWVKRQQQILEKYPGDTRRQLIELSMGYVRFMLDNPQFRSILMMSENGGMGLSGQARTSLSPISVELIGEYCRQAGISSQVQMRKTYVVKSLIYGAALMMDSGEMPDDEQTEQIIRQAIAREFDLS